MYTKLGVYFIVWKLIDGLKKIQKGRDVLIGCSLCFKTKTLRYVKVDERILHIARLFQCRFYM